MGWSELSELARAHRGVVDLGSVHEAELARSTVEERAGREGWWRPFPGVVALPGSPRDRLTRLHAAILAVGAPVAATRWTAASLYGLREPLPRLIQLVLPNGRRHPRLPGVEALRSRTFLPDRDLAVIAGLPCVTSERMVRDLAGVTDPAGLRAVVIDARQRRRLDIGAAFEEAMAFRFPGRRRLLRILAETDANRCDSVFEYLVRAALERAGIRLDPAQVEVTANGRALHIDLGIAPLELGIECVGAVAHSTRRQRHRDMRRANSLALVDRWLILQVDWDRYTTDLEGFLGEVVAAVLRRCEQRGLSAARFLAPQLISAAPTP